MPIYPYKFSPTGTGAAVNYFVDAPGDISSLPAIGEISGGSTAYVISTGDVYVLTCTGWVTL